MKLTQELVGAALGVVLILAAILGLPYLALSFVEWSFDPETWNGPSRFFCVVIVAIASCFYASQFLPDTEDKPFPLYDDQTGARLQLPPADRD